CIKSKVKIIFVFQFQMQNCNSLFKGESLKAYFLKVNIRLVRYGDFSSFLQWESQPSKNRNINNEINLNLIGNDASRFNIIICAFYVIENQMYWYFHSLLTMCMNCTSIWNQSRD
ncbi:hypothetical protein O6P43_020942, partial [Quillaja saponaria]